MVGWDAVPEAVLSRWRSACVEYERAEAGRRDTPQCREAVQAAATAGHRMAEACRGIDRASGKDLSAWVGVVLRTAERHFRHRASRLDLIADTLALVAGNPWAWPRQLHRLCQLRRRHRQQRLQEQGDAPDDEPGVGAGRASVTGWDPAPERVLTGWTAAYAEYRRTQDERRDTPDSQEAVRAAATAGRRLADACRVIEQTTGDDLPPWLLWTVRIAEHQFRDRAARLDKHADTLALITLTPWSWLRRRQRNHLHRT